MKSDQPKPATGEVCGFSGNTIPASGEWTGEMVEAFAKHAPQPWTKALAMAINAALAATKIERESTIEELEQQLAAERERANRLEVNHHDTRTHGI